MAINPPSVSSIDIQDSLGDVRIEMLNEEPIAGKKFDPKRTPGQIAGYYSQELGGVRLYSVASTGDRFLRIV